MRSLQRTGFGGGPSTDWIYYITFSPRSCRNTDVDYVQVQKNVCPKLSPPSCIKVGLKRSDLSIDFAHHSCNNPSVYVVDLDEVETDELDVQQELEIQE